MSRDAVKLASAGSPLWKALSTSAAVGAGSDAFRGAYMTQPCLVMFAVMVKVIGGVKVAAKEVIAGGLLSVVRTFLQAANTTVGA